MTGAGGPEGILETVPDPDDEDHDCGAPLAIGAVARHLGVSVEAVRYYEAEGLVDPARDDAGRRSFAQRDMDALHVVHTMREAGFSMADVRALIAVKSRADPAVPDSPDVLVSRARDQLKQLRAGIARRQAALRRSRRLIDRWLADLDSTGV